MVKSSIATIEAPRNDLKGELANLPSLKELNQQVLTSGLYCEQEFQQAGANTRQVFINAGQAFLDSFIEILQERFPSETLNICKALDLVVNPQSLPQSDIAAYGVDALNKLIKNYGQQKTVVGNKNVNPLIDPEVTRVDYLQFKFLLNTHHLLSMQEFSKKFPTRMKVSVNSFPTYKTLVNIALTILVSSAACERGFSCQNRIKAGLQNRLNEQNQDNPMKVAIEGPPWHIQFSEDRRNLQQAVLLHNIEKPSCLSSDLSVAPCFIMKCQCV